MQATSNRILPAVIVVLAGLFLSNSARNAWTNYWLLKDGRIGEAMITSKAWSGVGAFNYTYAVDKRSYEGSGQQGKQPPVVGQRSSVYFSASHPWISALDRPQPVSVGLPAAIVALVLGFFSLLTAINPRSRWAFKLQSNGNLLGGSRIVSRDERVVELRSLDDVPPAFRGKVEEALKTHHLSIGDFPRFRVRGADGVERSYHSLEEMPADLRAMVEKAMNDRTAAIVGAPAGPEPQTKVTWSEDSTLIDERIEIVGPATRLSGSHDLREIFGDVESDGRPREPFTFRYQGRDGHEQVFHSLEEMPPHIRAVYDQLHRGLDEKRPGPSDPNC
jgi:hypothetical protein